ncbi:ATP-binding protein [Streptomyces sp. NPDC059398]|uniref:ATP-binding protein n=1 Tax=Streptomyces sp. NPDC059398 TaxID=3346820 RepID=UPI0036755CAE
MDVETQHPLLRERFYRRERRSVRAAREFTRSALTDWEAAGRADEVLLCVSELATNAVLHGVPPGRGYRLQLRSYGDGLLRVEVHDSGDGVPRIAAVADETGRGLLLVEALADRWGVSSRSPGKTVWCEFD